ncbi:alpha/beta fold hydrolase [Corynebacterium uropygiale]|uniref:Alpha/beta fold hydrolase n=1 Tax=Corynebacterium uropygiale TaxID=1775911 RepID=A0A9X1QQC7_9CORY|nr:alpha/beta fold hydrolase [Corynebacterium uropygiale]MCF4007722.1 alpha/beta fold hydrolase [Corynebacterium uropygiale]
MMRSGLAALSALTMGLGIAAGAGTAHAAEVAGWTGMGPQLAPQDNISAAIAHGMAAQDASPSGANEECTPRPGENPVVLIHGMVSTPYGSFAALAPALKAQGKCVYSFTYGRYNSPASGSSAMGFVPGFDGGLAPMDKSLAEVTEHIQRVKEHTGAEKVDIVGWSQGGSLATAYAKQSGGKDVGTVVSLAGVLRGTSMLGLANLHHEFAQLGLPISQAVDLTLGASGNDLLEHSDFMTRLKDGGLEVDGVHYVSIATLFDESANPLGNDQYSSKDYQNIVLQDGCPSDASDHLGVPYDPRSIALTQNALGGNVPVPCTGTVGPFIPGSSI